MSNQVYGLGSLNTSAGLEKLVVLKNRHFWVLSGSNWVLQPYPGKYLTADTETYHDEFLDCQFWANGVDLNRTYDGTNWSLTKNVERSPIGTYPKNVGARMYLANIKFKVGATTISFPSRVAYSDSVEQDENGNFVIKWGFTSGTDLKTTAGSSTVTAMGGTAPEFKRMGIQPNDPFYIISGNNAKKYIVSTVESESQLTLTENVVNAGTGQSYWVTNNYGEIKTNDSDSIKGIGDNGGNVMVFKQNSLFRCDATFLSVVQVKGVPGTTSHKSITNLRDFTFYYHPTGIWRYDGVTSTLISEPIWDVIQGISSANYGKVMSWTDKARYVKFFVGDIAENSQTNLPAISNCVLMYDIALDIWSLSSFEKVFKVSTPWVESGVPKIYAGATDGNVYQLETGTNFDGSAIPFRLVDQARYPIAKEVSVDGARFEKFADRDQNLAVQYRRINQPHQDDERYTPVEKNFPQNRQRFRGIQLELQESSQDPSFLFEAITIFYTGGDFDK